MISLKITAMKPFMGKLLASDTFDCFLLEEAVIGTANTFTIDGHINKEFYANASVEESSGNIPCTDFRPWSELKGLCFELIKGKRPPLFFRIVLHLMPQKAEALLSREGCDLDPTQLRALVLTIRYDGFKAVLTTGTSFQTFVLSKEPDKIWDKSMQKYLDVKGISYTEDTV